MNSICKHLKQKLNGKFECKLTKDLICLSQCKSCKKYERKEAKTYDWSRNNKSVLKPLKNRSKKDTNNTSIMPKSIYYSNFKIKYAHKHHCIGGRNRNNSEKYGLFFWVNAEQHKYIHDNPNVADMIKQEAQKQWEMYYGSRDEFIEIFGKSFIDKKSTNIIDEGVLLPKFNTTT